MINSIKLELKKNNMRGYLLTSIISMFILLVSTYFIAIVSKVENNPVFQNYENIFKFTSILASLVFCILSARMFSQFIFEDNRGKGKKIVFSHTASGMKVLLAKILSVCFFTTFSMIMSYALYIVIFSVGEIVHPIVSDQLTIQIISSIFKKIITLAVTVTCFGVISMGIGFTIKSIRLTMLSSFLILAMFGNTLGGIEGHHAVRFMLQSMMIAISVIILLMIIQKVNTSDVKS